MSEEARNYFPRGLSQPDNGFRFSTDSLFITSFASIPSRGKILDLGTGSGVIPLGLALRGGRDSLRIDGLEINPEMISAARSNIAMLGFEKSISVIEGNVCKPDFAAAESYDMVISNPPYRTQGRGRDCTDSGRNYARFEVEANLDDFCRSAARMVKNRGRVCFVFLAERLAELIVSFTRCKLEPKRIKFVHGRADLPAKVVMLEAVKNGKPGLITEPALVLYEENGSPTDSSLEYCSFIAK